MSDATVPLVEILSRLETELSRVETMSRGLEDVAAAAILGHAIATTGDRASWQELDRLTQTAADLRRAVAGLATQCGAAPPVALNPVTRDLRLEQVRAALTGSSTAPTPSSEPSFF
ncbi:hypothetical protein [Palleronia pelagia]|uniref:Uncharacterized protein n=1 Tax=Palleronia pelagia TaxID=387096 RepID=A0A1H8B0K1_9RHOB|nr:hypothetical protein [Palleronia pelagia]SEM75608.1 hypothetical protein SAMN04488011_101361 [Palleronia pelagia]